MKYIDNGMNGINSYEERSTNCKIKKFMVRSSYLIVLQLVLILNFAHADIYPVQVIPQLIPPYTTTISNYYSSATDKLAVTLINTDMTKPTLGVRLRMYIESQSVKMRSKEGVYYPTIQLDAGVPLRLSQSDLAPYFNIDNLDLQGMTRLQYTQQGKLPEGFYTFSFEAVEVLSGQVVGRKTSAMAWITLSDPPLLNLPRKTESISYEDPQNIIFQWTPRNMSSPNSAFNTEYEFTLVEVWDNGIAPEAAFGMAQPLYRTTTKATTMLYGPSEPALMPGKRYAWRIQAKASNGIEDVDTYRNNGYSEIYWFTCQNSCKPVLNTTASVSGSRVNIEWTVPMNTIEGLNEAAYIVDYREKGQDAALWYSTSPSAASMQSIYELKKDKTYEYRVGRYCGVDVNMLASGKKEGAVYSDIKTFTMTGGIDTSFPNCGRIPPATNITNQNLLQTLHTGDVIKAGDFPVTIMKVSGSRSFTGTGYVTVPILGQNRIKVSFSNIGVNTDMQLISGVIETTYDKEEKQVAKLGDVIGQFQAIGEVISDLANIAIDKDYLEIKQLTDAIRKMAEEEMPEALKEKMNTALDNVEAAKKEYDAAEAKYKNATTPEEKAEAKKEMEVAKKKYETAKTDVKAIQKEQEELVKGVSDVVLAAVKKIRQEKDKEILSIKTFKEEVEDLNNKSNAEAATTTGSGTSSTDKVVIIGNFMESNEYKDAARDEFLKAASGLLTKKQTVKSAVIYKVFTDYFSKPENIDNKLNSDTKIDGKALIKQLLDKQQKKETRDAMILFAHDYLIKQIDSYINSLLK